jgi:succinate dehydrogenase/fumarate reductase cytochrome b subunit (b558 family)
MTPSAKEHAPFFLTRLHSLTGVLPVGTFFLGHLWSNATALQGRAAFDASFRAIDTRPSPFVPILEVFGIYLPLLFHAAFGVSKILRSRPNVVRYPYAKNWTYLLERATGVITFVFIVYHVIALRVPVALGASRAADYFPTLVASLSSTNGAGVPVVATVYMIGLAATAYHFAAGIAGFCFTWGITATRRENRIVSAASGAFGVALFLFGARTIVYFATGSAIVPPGESDVGTIRIGAAREPIR